MRPPDNARRRTLIFCFPPLALPKSGTVEDLSSSQPVAQAPALMIFISVCKHNTEPLSCQQQKSPRKVSENFKSKFHRPLMRWNLLLHE